MEAVPFVRQHCALNKYIVQVPMSHALVYRRNEISACLLETSFFTFTRLAHIIITLYKSLNLDNSYPLSTMSFDKMTFLASTSCKSLTLSTKPKTDKGRSFNSLLSSRSKSKAKSSALSSKAQDESPLSFLAVPYTTVDHAGRPFTDIPESVHERGDKDSSSGSDSTSSTVTETRGDYVAISVDRYKPVTPQLASILITPSRSASTRSNKGNRRGKQVRFVTEPTQPILRSMPAIERYDVLQGMSPSTILTNTSSHWKPAVHVRGGAREYYEPALPTRRYGLRRPMQSAAINSPPTPIEETENGEELMPISPLSPADHIYLQAPNTLATASPRNPLKRSNASYDSTTSTSSRASFTDIPYTRHTRHSVYTSSAQAAALALCNKIRAVRAGEVFARRAMLEKRSTMKQDEEDDVEEVGVDVQSDADAYADYDSETSAFCEGWGRRG